MEKEREKTRKKEDGDEKKTKKTTTTGVTTMIKYQGRRSLSKLARVQVQGFLKEFLEVHNPFQPSPPLHFRPYPPTLQPFPAPFSFFHPFPHHSSATPPSPSFISLTLLDGPPFNPACGLGNAVSFLSGSERSPTTQRLVVHFELKCFW